MDRHIRITFSATDRPVPAPTPAMTAKGILNELEKVRLVGGSSSNWDTTEGTR